jgi:Flp pilus assembly protein TadG
MRGNHNSRSTRSRSRRSSRSNRGSALVEFAFLIPVIFALVFGIIDFGRAMYSYHFVSNAAREASRWASVRGSTCTGFPSACPASSSDVANYVVSIAPAGIDSSSSRLTVNPGWPAASTNPPVCASYSNHPGCVVQVQITYQFNFILPFLPSSGIPMTSTSQMIISQ